MDLKWNIVKCIWNVHVSQAAIVLKQIFLFNYLVPGIWWRVGYLKPLGNTSEGTPHFRSWRSHSARHCCTASERFWISLHLSRRNHPTANSGYCRQRALKFEPERHKHCATSYEWVIFSFETDLHFSMCRWNNLYDQSWVNLSQAEWILHWDLNHCYVPQWCNQQWTGRDFDTQGHEHRQFCIHEGSQTAAREAWCNRTSYKEFWVFCVWCDIQIHFWCFRTWAGWYSDKHHLEKTKIISWWF